MDYAFDTKSLDMPVMYNNSGRTTRTNENNSAKQRKANYVCSVVCQNRLLAVIDYCRELHYMCVIQAEAEGVLETKHVDLIPSLVVDKSIFVSLKIRLSSTDPRLRDEPRNRFVCRAQWNCFLHGYIYIVYCKSSALLKYWTRVNFSGISFFFLVTSRHRPNWNINIILINLWGGGGKI